MTTKDLIVTNPSVNFDKEFELPERIHTALPPSIYVPFAFNFSEEDMKTIPMPPTFSINTFGRILLKQNYTNKDVIYYTGGDRTHLLETIFKNEKTTDFFDRLLMATVYFSCLTHSYKTRVKVRVFGNHQIQPILFGGE